jgi:dTDP-4-amino-4,6-dideoxygalactose transaminase
MIRAEGRAMAAEHIPFGDLGREVREIRREVDAAVARVFDRGWFVLGGEGEAFEGEFAAFVGAEHAVGCGNGTDAITLALRALGLGPGDEVITVANTCVPTAAGIRDAGCELRLVDCDPRTLQMNPEALRRAITPSTGAVVPVHLYGSTPDMEAVQGICSEAGVPIVEDCAQAHGAAFDGRNAGTWGALSCWSFYPSKNLGAYGDGGAVATDDSALAERLRMLRNYGQRVRYHHDEEGRNSRLDEVQAAVLRAKLRHLPSWNDRRRALAARYEERLAGATTLVEVPERCTPVRHLFPVRVATERRDAVRARMQELGVDTQIHYPIPLHRQKAYAHLFAGESYPAAEAAAGELISLPLYPQLDVEEIDRVVDVFLESIES